MKNTREGIYEILLDLVKCPSVSPGPGEVKAAQLIHDKLASLPYFRASPAHLELVRLEGDPLGRSAVLALARAKPATARTIILTGHFDVVETKESRALVDLAFDPERYTAQLSSMKLDDEARHDLESGNFLFGRGVMDMKCGLALQMALLAELSEQPEKMPCNLLFLAVCDEEVNSAGMRAAIKRLASLRVEEGLDYLACINSEGFIPREPGDRRRYVHLGTIGKIMPMFYCVGHEAHVGQYFSGLNANLLASAVNLQVEGSPELADSWNGLPAPPPTALKLRDLRDAYSVTLPARAVTYFNFLTVTRTPAQVLAQMRQIATTAFETAIDQVRNSAAKLAERSGLQPPEVPWRPKVMTYEELLREVEKGQQGALPGHIASFLQSLPESMDERDRCIALVGELLRLYPDKSPAIIIGFLPPYYPHRSNDRQSPRERGLVESVDELREEARSRFDANLVTAEHFNAISDLSYLGFKGAAEELQPLADNTPAWGQVYDIPLDDLLALDVPVVNLGPAGKNPHEFTERLELGYSLEVVPHLLKSLVFKLSKLP
ncbi:MAG: M20/M25/M40 family metallo-hydrolase [Myxococcales bacterium]